MNKLNEFSAWQWELAITASRLQLGLLDDDEMIAFTHKLMDKGYYDDVMLEVIDDDPLYPDPMLALTFANIWQYFNLVQTTIDQAKLINTLQRFYALSVFPPNLYAYLQLAKDDKFYQSFEDMVSNWHDDSTYVDIEDMPPQMYYFEDTLFDYLNRDTKFEFVLETLNEMTLIFANWVKRNETTILNTMHQLFETEQKC